MDQGFLEDQEKWKLISPLQIRALIFTSDTAMPYFLILQQGNYSMKLGDQRSTVLLPCAWVGWNCTYMVMLARKFNIILPK
jgi:hypothetical protein